MVGINTASGTVANPTNSGRGNSGSGVRIGSPAGGSQRPPAGAPGTAGTRTEATAAKAAQAAPAASPGPANTQVQRQQPADDDAAPARASPGVDPALPGRALAAAHADAERLDGDAASHGVHRSRDAAARAQDFHPRHVRASREIENDGNHNSRQHSVQLPAGLPGFPHFGSAVVGKQPALFRWLTLSARQRRRRRSTDPTASTSPSSMAWTRVATLPGRQGPRPLQAEAPAIRFSASSPACSAEGLEAARTRRA